MCGIAGWLDWKQQANVKIVQDMCNQMAHRGPDAARVIEDGPIIMGHRRLSVIDIDSRSDQPLYDSSQRYVITYNGEIYNYRELRSQLVSIGAQFNTTSDTEVILESYKAWGDSFVERLNGMFAFALWDTKSERLLLGRDRVGEKPLFYLNTGSGIAFASEPHVFRGRLGIGFEPDPVALKQFLSIGYPVGDHCLVPSVKRLSPAHTLSVDRRGIAPQIKYWDLSTYFKNKKRYKNTHEAAEELSGLIDNSVNSMLVSDVPLGAFLSGGIDSSTIVASMAALGNSKNVTAFTCGFPQESFNELPQATSVANFLGVKHYPNIISATKAANDKMFESACSEPLADSSFFPTWYLSQFARKHVTVALSGDGGDEAFLGYPTYVADRLHRLVSRLPPLVTKLGSNIVDRLPANHRKVSFEYKAKQFLKGCQVDASTAHFVWRELISQDLLDGLLCGASRIADRNADESANDVFQKRFKEVEECHYLDQMSYVDFKTWLPDDILVKVDRASMAHSLEVRAPFLDHRIVEFAASLPVDLKLKGFRGKWLLKQSQATRLPKSILYRKKLGFNAPVSSWITDELSDFFDSKIHGANVAKWLNVGKIEQLQQEHRKMKKDNGLALLAIMNLAIWLGMNENG